MKNLHLAITIATLLAYAQPIISEPTVVVGPHEVAKYTAPYDPRTISKIVMGLKKLCLNHSDDIRTHLINTCIIIFKGLQIAGNLRGMGNIVDAIDPIAKKYGITLTPADRDIIVDMCVSIEPQWKNIAQLRDLKQKKHTLIFTTNQDVDQYRAYATIMKSHGVEMDKLFDGIITYQTFSKTPHKYKEHDFYEVTPGHYAVKELNPSKSFFNALTQGSKSLNRWGTISMCFNYKNKIEKGKEMCEKNDIAYFRTFQELYSSTLQ